MCKQVLRKLDVQLTQAAAQVLPAFVEVDTIKKSTHTA